ncbi:anti-sigma factor [Caldanaerobacter subterraneus]|uniref:anti-sigma factor n=1 Tax=Caldanaerobacter subterraneus TaxID=911092 RepID=UPI003464ACDE
MCYDEGTLQAYLDGELNELTSKNIEEHVKTCSTCRQKLEELKFINEFTANALKTSNIDLNDAWIAFNEKLSKENNKRKTNGKMSRG